MIKQTLSTMPILAVAGLVIATPIHAHDGRVGNGWGHNHVGGGSDELVYPNGTKYLIDNSVGSSITVVMPKDGRGAICQGEGADAGHKKRCKELLGEAIDSGEPKRPDGTKPPKNSKPADDKKPKTKASSQSDVIILRKGGVFKVERIK